MNIKILPFTIELYDRVFALWKECEGVGLSAADSKESIRSYLERNPGMSFVAMADDELVGSVLCGHDGRRGYIYHLSVHPAYRRQGLASQLVERCLQGLKQICIQKCHIFIFKDNVTGIEFWKKIGWVYRTDISVISKTINGTL